MTRGRWLPTRSLQIGVLATIVAGAIPLALWALGQGVDDEAEIPFDHSVHAGQYGMPCLSCHSFATRSTVAGIPSVQSCMGCHKLAGKDKPAVQTMARRFAEGKGLSFTRRHDLPDHVYFSHRVHHRAEVACADCHGAVESMASVARTSSLEMGWCLSCHRQRGASVDCLDCHK